MATLCAAAGTVLATLGVLGAFALSAAEAQATITHNPIPVLTLTGGASDPGSSHPPKEFKDPCGVATDSHGDIYVASYENNAIDVFNPNGEFLVEIAAAGGPCSLAVNSAGDVYAFDFNTGDVVEYAPSAYPPSATTSYSAPIPIDSSGSDRAVAVDPANDRVYVDQGTQIVEYDSAAHGSGVLNAAIGLGTLSNSWGLDVYGANGDVYASDANAKVVYVFDPTGTIVLQTINGTNVPSSPGGFTGLREAYLAVDQSNGHVYVGDALRKGELAHSLIVDEFDASGAYVSQLTEGFKDTGGLRNAEPSGIIVDDSGGANQGNIYVTNWFGRLDAFGPDVVIPDVTTDVASNVTVTGATLNGTVNPNGIELTDCHFFLGATAVPCSESVAQIGTGSLPVMVHANVSLSAGTLYNVRLDASNKNGSAVPDAGQIFATGATIDSTSTAHVGPSTADLEAKINPEGLATTSHFEYGTTTSYGLSTPESPSIGSDSTDHVATGELAGLTPETTYHYRVVATNAVGTVFGPDRVFTTFPLPGGQLLPDNRAYELVSPPDKGGGNVDGGFLEGGWRIPLQSSIDGNAVTFVSSTAFPGSQSSLLANQYLARRGPNGWSTQAITPIQDISELPASRQESEGPLANGPYQGFSETSPTASCRVVGTLARSRLRSLLIGCPTSVTWKAVAMSSCRHSPSRRRSSRREPGLLSSRVS